MPSLLFLHSPLLIEDYPSTFLQNKRSFRISQALKQDASMKFVLTICLLVLDRNFTFTKNMCGHFFLHSSEPAVRVDSTSCLMSAVIHLHMNCNQAYLILYLLSRCSPAVHLLCCSSSITALAYL